MDIEVWSSHWREWHQPTPTDIYYSMHSASPLTCALWVPIYGLDYETIRDLALAGF